MGTEHDQEIDEGSAELVPPKHWAWYILTSDCEYSPEADFPDCHGDTHVLLSLRHCDFYP